MLKKTKPVFSSQNDKFKRFTPGGAFDHELAIRRVLAAAGRFATLCGMSIIEPGSSPRKSLLKTRIVKNEFGVTSKRNVFNCAALDLPPFIRVKIDVHRDAPIGDESFFQACRSGQGLLVDPDQGFVGTGTNKEE